MPFSDEEAYIAISNKKQIHYSTGQSFQSSFVMKGQIDLDRVYLIVISKSVIVLAKKLPSTSFDFSFEITNRMVPEFRVLLLGYTKNSQQHVADSFRVFVKQNVCGVQVQASTQQTRPGQNVTFTMKGQPGDVVGLQAVDESVYALRNKRSLTRAIYQKVLQESDSGCGPGGGANSIDVIQNLGLKVMSSHEVINDWNTCRKRTMRKKMAENEKKEDSLLAAKCCMLGFVDYEKRMPCADRAKVIQKHMNHECAVHFLDCCKHYSKMKIPKYSLSASFGTPTQCC